jgi:X-Pro dipeptidyl-peptidase
MRGWAGKVVLGALALAIFGIGGTAQAADPAGTLGPDGKTAPIYNYKTAIRERVFIPQPGSDTDRNGQMDWITADIIRPVESSAANKMPAIIDPSPYYTTLCRGNESQCMADWDNDGVNDQWPLFYDNYFVPRGYAYILGQMLGTGYTTNGCPMHGGPTDIAGEKSIVDWLNGRVKAYKSADLSSPEVVADWHNGSSAMIGKSYDGTLSNGVAATGVEGLKTIVPVSAISAWYNYSRTGGVRMNTNYPGSSLNPQITYNGVHAGINLPDRRPICQPVNNDLNNDANTDTGDGDAHGDINTFWKERDYNLDPSKIKAAVFATHGFQDDNVRMDHEGMWWKTLEQAGVPHKLWLMRTGHTDPFESRRAVWVDTLHRWFDHFLYGVNNNIQNEPRVTIEEERDVWKDYTDWPIPGTKNLDLYLRASDGAAGTLGALAGGGTADTQTYTGNGTSENLLLNMNAAETPQTVKRVYLSRVLTKDVRLSGTGAVDLVASLGSTQTNLSVTVADYSATPFTQVTRSGEGITNTGTTASGVPAKRTCWGDTGAGGPDCTVGSECTASASTIDTACYLEVVKPLITIPFDANGINNDIRSWRVTRGLIDSSNRDSLWFQDASPVTVDQKYHFKFPLMPTEHIFKAGHQIQVIVSGTNTGIAQATGNVNVPITLDTRASKVTLPILGGYGAAASAGVTEAETVAPVLGNDMPADISTTTTASTGKTVTFTLPSATDNEDPTPVVTCDPASGSNFAVGTTTVSCVATDANGNVSAPKTFKVTVTWITQKDGTVGGSVPATLSLTLGTPAAFGPLTAGIAKDYAAQTTATVISTAANAELRVADPSSTATGHLVNGTFSLPSALQANAGGPFADVGGSAAPTLLKSWTAPTSNENVTIAFQQHVGSSDALRTGAYSKTLTFTLSTTQP